MPAAPPLAFLPPRFDRRVLALSRLLLPIGLRTVADIRELKVTGGDRLVSSMASFEAGESRLLLAFRHPSISDPLCLASLLWRELPRQDRQQGRRLRGIPHSFFLYDRGIPLWAGAPLGWLLQRLGGTSIQRGKLDTAALRSARALLLDGSFPFAAAPEGATNGHNELVSPLEPGIAQLAFWTAEDLARSERAERMIILPIGLQYSWCEPIWGGVDGLLCDMERNAGLSPPTAGRLDPDLLYGRLLVLAERMLELLEQFYRRAYQRDLPELSGLVPRLERLLTTALEVVEESLGVRSAGSLDERCRRLEQAAWERLYPPAGEDESRCQLQRGLADRLADETEGRLWHMRMVESFTAVSGSYVRERPSQERFADTLLLLWDTQCRLLGTNPARRPRLGPRRAQITMGAPIAVEERLAEYRKNRRQAVAALTSDLQRSLEGLISPSGLPG